MKKDNLNKTDKIGIILLAAGASRRMGTPKQLLEIGKETLIERAIRITKQVDNSQTVVVLGANADKIKPIIKEDKSTNVIINEDWQKGMGTTLQAGIRFLLKKTPALEAVIASVCDQPYLNEIILGQLIIEFKKREGEIIAAAYANIKGVPALFSKTLFPKLLTLNEDEGARKIIKNYTGKVLTIDFPKGEIDLDTPESYQQFLKIEK